MLEKSLRLRKPKTTPSKPTGKPARKGEALHAPDAFSGGRLLSLDALRGFNMFWIIGGEEIVSQIAKKWDNPTFHEISENLTSHMEWRGFHFYDMIFPLFLFLIGVALPYSMSRRKQSGETRRQMAWKIIRRTAFLFFLGWIYSGLFEFNGFDHLRIMGVLQRLALGYGAAALIMLYTNVRGQAVAGGGLLVFYWLMMRWMPVPGQGADHYSQLGNFANYVDRLLFYRTQLYIPEYGDPEGLFSTIPAIATALLGVMAGHWLRRPEKPTYKATIMFIAGAACISAGYLWSIDFPVIKKIWTSSYVLVAGGWSILLLTLFYWLIDIRGWKAWAFPLVVIGMNPITIYVGQRIINFDYTAEFFVKGCLKFMRDDSAAIVMAASVVFVKWLFLYFLYRKRIFLRV